MRTDRTCTRSPSAAVAWFRIVPSLRVTTARKENVAGTAGSVGEHDDRVFEVVPVKVADYEEVVRQLDNRPRRGTHRGRPAGPATVGERH